jgi:hypothetical protein
VDLLMDFSMCVLVFYTGVMLNLIGFVMAQYFELTKDMLPNVLSVDNDEVGNFDQALGLAFEEAAGHMSDPMLLGWYDRRKGAFSPNVECCSEKKPGWVVYAETRGGSLTVEVNGGAYYFIYRDFL